MSTSRSSAPTATAPTPCRQRVVRFVVRNKETTAIVVSHDRHVSMMFWADELAGVVMIRNAHWWQ